MDFLANTLADTGMAVANTGSNACMLWLADEPECPEALIK